MKKNQLFLVLIIGLICAACKESSNSDEVTTLTVEPSSLTFSADGGSSDLTINSNTSWTITSSKEDIMVSPLSGSGNKTVKVTVPPRNIFEQISSRVVVKSLDGKVIRNIDIIQEGILVTGGVLEISNHQGVIALYGEAQSVDSLIIRSNAPWELKGPEWIEVYDGNRWIALSQSRAMISGNATLTNEDDRGGYTLYIRTAKDNNSEENREGMLILSQPYSGNLTCELTVIQLGYHRIFASNFVSLADGMATKFKCGPSVKSFSWYVTKENLTNEDFTEEFVSTWISGTNDPHMVYYWYGLDEDTTYNIYFWVETGKSKFWNSLWFKTGSSQNQAIAAIKNVYHDGSMWRWQIFPNELCKLFILAASDDPNLFNEPDVYIAWLIANGFPSITWRPTGTEYADYWWERNQQIQIITWGGGQDGINKADVITRYITSDSNITRQGLNREEPSIKSGSKKVDLEAFRKSVHMIKTQ